MVILVALCTLISTNKDATMYFIVHFRDLHIDLGSKYSRVEYVLY
jgi:hypothetical protein